MVIDSELLSILVCPETHQKVSMAGEDLLKDLNTKIKAGTLKNRQGDTVGKSIDEALLRDDGKCAYIIDEGIPNMLIDERVDL